jgi:hypothetical protein
MPLRPPCLIVTSTSRRDGVLPGVAPRAAHSVHPYELEDHGRAVRRERVGCRVRAGSCEVRTACTAGFDGGGGLLASEKPDRSAARRTSAAAPGPGTTWGRPRRARGEPALTLASVTDLIDFGFPEIGGVLDSAARASAGATTKGSHHRVAHQRYDGSCLLPPEQGPSTPRHKPSRYPRHRSAPPRVQDHPSQRPARRA